MSGAPDASQARPAGASGGWGDNPAGPSLQGGLAPVYGTTMADPSMLPVGQLPLGSAAAAADALGCMPISWQWQQPPQQQQLGVAMPNPAGGMPQVAVAPQMLAPQQPPPPLSDEEERKQRELLEYLDREYEKGERAYERELQRRRKQPQQPGSGAPGASAPSPAAAASSGGSDGGLAGPSSQQHLKLTFERPAEDLLDSEDPAAAPAPPQKKRKGSSRFRGVVRKEVPGKEMRVRWRAEMTLHGKSTWLGYYETEEMAARVFDVATIFHKVRNANQYTARSQKVTVNFSDGWAARVADSLPRESTNEEIVKAASAGGYEAGPAAEDGSYLPLPAEDRKRWFEQRRLQQQQEQAAAQQGAAGGGLPHGGAGADGSVLDPDGQAADPSVDPSVVGVGVNVGGVGVGVGGGGADPALEGVADHHDGLGAADGDDPYGHHHHVVA